jgi:hypothetical protein
MLGGTGAEPRTTGARVVVATLRASESCPDAVATLWRCSHADRPDLQGLSAAELAAMVEAHVGTRLELAPGAG